ncbi:MAG: hypothetical protein KGH54_00005 [Candidatus Micrarchaeota archaeon]|nr:hypothetical protein [Planctomycetota bacterium]MDE1850166.1 hypothetical protein [Candidatus Micrarchaeota archaeon]
MKIVIIDKPYLERLCKIQNFFGPADAVTAKMLEGAEFLGKEFYLYSKIYEQMNLEINRLGKNNFWKSFSDGKNIDPKLLSLLKKLSYRSSNRTTSIREISRQIQNNLPKFEKNIKKELQTNFGFTLPTKIGIILGNTTSISHSSASALSYEPILIYLEIPSYKTKAVGVILHELLHTLIDQNKSLPADSNTFEEALLDYFVPNGIMAQKLGIVPKMKLNELFEKNIKDRPYSLAASKKLLKIIKKYNNTSHRGTIWSFLKLHDSLPKKTKQ